MACDEALSSSSRYHLLSSLSRFSGSLKLDLGGNPLLLEVDIAARSPICNPWQQQLTLIKKKYVLEWHLCKILRSFLMQRPLKDVYSRTCFLHPNLPLFPGEARNLLR